jgi:hypothetical protein
LTRLAPSGKKAVVIGVIVAVVLALILILPRLHSSVKPQPATQQSNAVETTTLYVASCSLKDIVEIARKASTVTGLGYAVVKPGQSLPPKSILVIDYRGCMNELERVATMMVHVLKSNGTVLIVGSPLEVSRLVKSQRELSMFFPLPNANKTIIYALHVRKLVRQPGYNSTIAIVDASYMLDVNVNSLVKLVRLAYTEWIYATTTRQPVATIGASS